MERWRMQENELSEKLRLCNREGSIQIVSGEASSPAHRKAHKSSQRLRTSDNPDPYVQQLLSTCNYWIGEYNANPSATNNSFQTTACRALDAKLAHKDQAPSATPVALRSLSECIKPNNLIDNEVQECRQGLREPVWKP